MDPIVLNEFGEKLIVDNSTISWLEINDDYSLGIPGGGGAIVVGMHNSNWVHLIFISKTHYALFCGNCGLRIVVPIEINTYGKLREWCAEQIEERKRIKEALEWLISQHSALKKRKECLLERWRKEQEALKNPRIAAELDYDDINPEDEPPNHSRFGVPGKS